MPDAPPKWIVLERVRSCANGTLKPDGENYNKGKGSADKKEVGSLEDQTVFFLNHEELMTKFKSVLSSTSADLLQNLLGASMCLEIADKGCINESLSGVCKSKSLVGRWLERLQCTETSDRPNKLPETTVNEGDTVTLTSDKASVSCQNFRQNNI